MFMHYEKKLLKDFVTSLLNSTNWNNKTYNLIIFIINQLTKIVYYKAVKVIIYVFSFLKVIIYIVI